MKGVTLRSHKRLLRRLLECFATGLLTALAALTPYARGQEASPPAADEINSDHFLVTVDGKPVQVLHAALNLYFLNIAAARHHRITVTAPVDGFWDRGVEVQPWRLNIRPAIAGRTVSFRVDGVAKLTLSRPGDFLAQAEMLFLFANPPEHKPPVHGSSSLRYYGPGIHHENIDAHSGDTIYLAPGAVVFGSLNLWQVSHVRVFGRGVVVYDGPQNPADDDGWMHKPNWHCIVMDGAHDISIEGITCVVRSRTWQIQMKDSRGVVFDNVKVIGANGGNANADGMDWLGGGDTIVRNSFFRAADDVFALQSGWNGYSEAALADPGQPVTNILVENTEVSTSISNIVRAAWPRKNFEGGNFTMRDVDVLHSGLGGCGISFALMEMWADPGGRGESSGFHFDDIRLEDWYTLFQLQQPTPGIRDVSFTDVMAPEQPALAPSMVRGDVSGVRLDDVVAAGTLVRQPADLPVVAEAGAPVPAIANTAPHITLRPVEGLVRPGQKVHLEAESDAPEGEHLTYTWLFGDGGKAKGSKVSHRFPDVEGTMHDGSGRFRVLLHVATAQGRNIWLYQPIVVSRELLPARPFLAGVAAVSGEGSPSSPAAPFDVGEGAEVSGTATAAVPPVAPVTIEGDLIAPVDGTYRFLVIASGPATLALDGRLLAQSPPPFAQVCGLAGDAERPISVYVALAAGAHHLQVRATSAGANGRPRVLWQTPGSALQPLGAAPAAPLPGGL